MSCTVRLDRPVAASLDATPASDGPRQAGASRWGRLVRLGGLAVAGLLGVAQPATAAPVCGPGAHWVDACPGGVDFFPLTNGSHTIDVFGVGQFTLVTTGPTTVWRGAGSTTPDHHIDTEMVALSLSVGGLTLTAGDGSANGLNDGPLHSPGRITEQAGDSTMADSFFDIFFEIDGTPFGPLHNDTPCRMEAVLDRVPPLGGTTYICNLTLGPIFLIDANGTQRGQLLSTSHEIPRIPAPPTLLLAGLALVALGLARRRASRGR